MVKSDKGGSNSRSYYAERRFGATLAIGCCITATALFLLGHMAAAVTIVAIAFFHLTAAILAPGTLIPSRFILEGALWIAGNIIAVTVLGIFYFALLTPFSIMWRLIGKDNLRRHPPHWHLIPQKDNDPETLRRLF